MFRNCARHGKYFYNQSQIQFYTEKGLADKVAYASFIDRQIVNYETNEFIPLE